MSIAENLKRHFENTPKEELDKEWEEIKQWNEIGPMCDKYFESLKKYDLYPQK